MSKSNAIILVIIFLVVSVAGAFGFVMISRNNNSKDNDKTELTTLESDNSEVADTDSKTDSSTQSYTDESGFSFKYPAGYSVTDITPATDSSYYSKVSVSNSNTELTVSVFDTKSKSIASWITSAESDYKSAKLTGSVNIGGVSASEYMDSTNNKSLILFIDQGVMYLFSAGTDSKSSDLMDAVTASFSFAPSTKQTGSSSGTSQSSEIIEDEEVVE